MRKTFAEELYKHMQTNKDIWLVVGDLGFGIFDKIRDDFPDRFLNTGAAEVAMMDIAIGLALEGKIPFVYSITTFLLYRPFEQIKLYINGEKINVKLIGSGRDKDYEIDGPSHDASDAKRLFIDMHSYESSQANYSWREEYNQAILGNVIAFWPETKGEIPNIVDKMVKSKNPEFLSLRR